jgi:hypothetical protein
VYRYSIQPVNFEKRWLVGFMVLTPLSTIFQLYRAGQFYLITTDVVGSTPAQGEVYNIM